MAKGRDRSSQAVDENLRQLGKCLVDLRKAAGKKVSELADELVVSKQFIYMLERGEAKPTEDRLNQLTKALNDYEGRLKAAAVQAIEADFVEKLKDAGLSRPQISETLSRVGAETKRDLWSGKEELKVAHMDETADELIGALDDGEEVLTLSADPGSWDMGEPDSASDYAGSVRDEFSTHKMTAPKMRTVSAAAPVSTQRIRAGRHARIEVDRPISREQKNALKALAFTIEHILKE